MLCNAATDLQQNMIQPSLYKGILWWLVQSTDMCVCFSPQGWLGDMFYYFTDNIYNWELIASEYSFYMWFENNTLCASCDLHTCRIEQLWCNNDPAQHSSMVSTTVWI